MENNRGTKVMALAALIVGVVGLTIGFAAFASTLTINSTATVTPTDTFQGTIKMTGPEGTGTELTCTGTVSGTATISDDTKVTVAAELAKPGDTVTCKGKVKNDSKYTAYLTSLSADGDKTGAAEGGSGATQNLITAALSDITMTVTIGSDTLNDGSESAVGTGSIDAGADEDITIVITYKTSSTNLVDGKFKVTFPVITATYSTVR